MEAPKKAFERLSTSAKLNAAKLAEAKMRAQEEQAPVLRPTQSMGSATLPSSVTRKLPGDLRPTGGLGAPRLPDSVTQQIPLKQEARATGASFVDTGAARTREEAVRQRGGVFAGGEMLASGRPEAPPEPKRIVREGPRENPLLASDGYMDGENITPAPAPQAPQTKAQRPLSDEYGTTSSSLTADIPGAEKQQTPLDDRTRAAVDDLDRQIAAAVFDGNWEAVRDLTIQRTKLLTREQSVERVAVDPYTNKVETDEDRARREAGTSSYQNFATTIRRRENDTNPVAEYPPGSGNKFQVFSPESYPAEFNQWLNSVGRTPAEFMDDIADAAVAADFPNATPDEALALKALMKQGYRGEGQVTYTPSMGAAVKVGPNNWQPRPDLIQNAIAANADPDLYDAAVPEVKQLADAMAGQERVSGMSQVKEGKQRAEELEKREAEEIMASFESDMAAVDAEADEEMSSLLRAREAKARQENAKNLRVAMNRMGRSGASPDAMASTSAELQAMQTADMNQQLAMLEYQQKEQAIQRKLSIAQSKQALALSLYNQAKSDDARREAQMAYNALQQSQIEMQTELARIQAEASQMSMFDYAGQMALGVFGQTLGTFTGYGAQAGARKLFG